MSFLINSIPDYQKIAEENFKRDGHVANVMLTVVDGSPAVYPILNKFDFSKEIQKLISERRINEFVIIFEAWLVPTQEISNVLNHLKNNELKDHPDAYEGICITYSSATDEIHCTTKINRDTMEFSWQRSENKVKFSITDLNARFQGLFLKAKLEEN